jgi:hypothetical protein
MYCNERVVGHCPDRAMEIKIAWSVNQEALPDGGTHQSVGDVFHVTQKCEHIPIDGGHADGFGSLTSILRKKNGRLFCRQADRVTIYAFYPRGVGPEGDDVSFRHPMSGWGCTFVSLEEASPPVEADEAGEYHWTE